MNSLRVMFQGIQTCPAGTAFSRSLHDFVVDASHSHVWLSGNAKKGGPAWEWGKALPFPKGASRQCLALGGGEAFTAICQVTLQDTVVLSEDTHTHTYVYVYIYIYVHLSAYAHPYGTYQPHPTMNPNPYTSCPKPW